MYIWDFMNKNLKINVFVIKAFCGTIGCISNKKILPIHSFMQFNIFKTVIFSIDSKFTLRINIGGFCKHICSRRNIRHDRGKFRSRERIKSIFYS